VLCGHPEQKYGGGQVTRHLARAVSSCPGVQRPFDARVATEAERTERRPHAPDQRRVDLPPRLERAPRLRNPACRNAWPPFPLVVEDLPICSLITGGFSSTNDGFFQTVSEKPAPLPSKGQTRPTCSSGCRRAGCSSSPPSSSALRKERGKPCAATSRPARAGFRRRDRAVGRARRQPPPPAWTCSYFPGQGGSVRRNVQGPRACRTPAGGTICGRIDRCRRARGLDVGQRLHTNPADRKRDGQNPFSPKSR